MTPEEIEDIDESICRLVTGDISDSDFMSQATTFIPRAIEQMEKYHAETESLRHERDTLLEANNGFKAGLMRILGTEHESYREYLNEIADLKSERDEDEIVRCPNCGVML